MSAPTDDPRYVLCLGSDEDRTEFWSVHTKKWTPRERHYDCDVCTTWRKPVKQVVEQ